METKVYTDKELCDLILCCVNPRLYNYCPVCGASVYSQLKHLQPAVEDHSAWLRYEDKTA